MAFTLRERFYFWREERNQARNPNAGPRDDRFSWEKEPEKTAKPLKAAPAKGLLDKPFADYFTIYRKPAAGKTYYAGALRDPNNPHGLPECPECHTYVNTNSVHRQHHPGCSEPSPVYRTPTPKPPPVLITFPEPITAEQETELRDGWHTFSETPIERLIEHPITFGPGPDKYRWDAEDYVIKNGAGTIIFGGKRKPTGMSEAMELWETAHKLRKELQDENARLKAQLKEQRYDEHKNRLPF